LSRLSLYLFVSGLIVCIFPPAVYSLQLIISLSLILASFRRKLLESLIARAPMLFGIIKCLLSSCHLLAPVTQELGFFIPIVFFLPSGRKII